ncbi:Cytochrome P450 89A2 [Acorus gramineus]|uniref:Cytochrome P450 89A2 n=1 Tax=Acorus gramineus TaxID=55184 RepID=A0AAV9AEJ4_ACOGR|nr:Cytochrome P450 89A2 [Acorus gramineus]
MEDWLLITLTISLPIILTLLFIHYNSKRKLPPGPPTLPIIGNLSWFFISLSDLLPTIRRLHIKYGPIITIPIGSRPFIFITQRDLAHKLFVNNGATFADRPPPSVPSCTIIASQYGPQWRLLRRNLTSEILHPSRVRSYGPARKWVLGVLAQDLMNQAHDARVVVPVESFRYSMFALLSLMCFGGKLEEKVIRDIEDVQRELLLYSGKLSVFTFMPRLTRLVFKKRWDRLVDIRRRQKGMFLPLMKAKKEQNVFSYADSLLKLRLDDRGLNDDEMVNLCSEFLNAGTDTTSTTLQWIMANVVKHRHVQAKILEEIKGVVGEEAEEAVEEDLQRMPYVKAVVMEGLRRHPPGHFVLPHAVMEEVCIDGYVIPKNASLNVMVADIGWDEKVWEEPMEFRPERFMRGGEAEGVDITGSREIKMMPFGVGRRICPGLGLALLHLEYFVANLVREFEWEAAEGEEIDLLSEKVEFTVAMKNPLKVKIVPRA